VFCHENDRESLGRLVRYALRPPFALDRMTLAPSGAVIYKMKRPLSDGTAHLVLAPADFLRRVASLVPPPRRHLVQYFGLFAPHARARATIVPRSPMVAPATSAEPEVSAAAIAPLPSVRRAAPDRIPSAELLQKVFAVDVFRCDRCGGRRRILAAITDP